MRNLSQSSGERYILNIKACKFKLDIKFLFKIFRGYSPVLPKMQFAEGIESAVKVSIW